MPTHSLARQAATPRHQARGTTNADGWGIAWYERAGAPPERHRAITPIWDDGAFAARSSSLRSGAFVAAARWASPGATIEETGNAPFVDGVWAFSLNGIVYGFTDGVGDELRARMEPARRARLVSDADTEVLFALVLQHLTAGMPAADALATVVHDVLAVTDGRLNFLLSDGALVHATRVGNSLFRRGPVIVSEPTDDSPGWTEIPDRSITTLTPDGATDTAL